MGLEALREVVVDLEQGVALAEHEALEAGMELAELVAMIAGLS